MNLALLMQAGQNSPLPTLLLFGGMAALFYFLLIRPQNKARKQMEQRLSLLKAGDEVLLSGGLYATIDLVEVDESEAVRRLLKGIGVENAPPEQSPVSGSGIPSRTSRTVRQAFGGSNNDKGLSVFNRLILVFRHGGAAGLFFLEMRCRSQ